MGHTAALALVVLDIEWYTTLAKMILPQARFCSWNNSEPTDPGVSRHVVSGSFAFSKQLGLGCANSLNFSKLIFNAATSPSYASSEVAVVNFTFPNFSDLVASGYTAIDNMRMWIPASSGTPLDLDGIAMEFRTSGVWVSNLSFPSGAGSQFPSSLPLLPNISRIDGNTYINGFGASNASEWIYIRVFADSSFPPGAYGACGSGVLRPRLTYDFY